MSKAARPPAFHTATVDVVSDPQPLPPPYGGAALPQQDLPESIVAPRRLPPLGPPAADVSFTRAPLTSRHPDQQGWSQPYLERALQAAPSTGLLPQASLPPAAIDPWWQASVQQKLFASTRGKAVDVSSLIYDSLRYSPTIQAISQAPLAREFTIIEADAEFDATAFVESRFLDVSEPVGSDLTTGGPTRFRDHDWDFEAGIRRRSRTGSEVRLSQQLGFQDTNSLFFNPTQQGTARLSFRLTQPLLRGRGQVYNTGVTVLAKIDSRIAWSQFFEQTQSHLLEVAEAYWGLYQGRAALLQRRRHHARALAILRELEARADVDASESQIATARSAVAARVTDLIRAETSIRDAQIRLRSLVTSPDLQNDRQLELIPTEAPSLAVTQVDPRDALLTAINHRPDIDEAFRQIQAASLRAKLAKNELLPMLNLVLETYVSGLQGESNLGRAWLDQFSIGEPSYSVGFVYERSLYNRAACARHKRRQLELRQVANQFRSRVETLMAEVEVATRRVNASYSTVLSTQHAVAAAEHELYGLEQRLEHLPLDTETASSSLENLLASQNRLADAELSLLDARITYALSFYELSRTLGTLLEQHDVSYGRGRQCGVPEVQFLTPAQGPSSGDPAPYGLLQPGVVHQPPPGP